MASSASTTSGDDEGPSAPPRDPSDGVAPPQAHAEWAASMQAYYAAGGQPYAWHAAQVRTAAMPPFLVCLFVRVARVWDGAVRD